MIKLMLLFWLISSLNGANISLPKTVLQASGGVVDLVLDGEKLYSATNASCVDVFDMQTKALTQKIEISKITDFMGDTIDSKVYSVDVLNNKVLILSQAEKGFRRVHIHMLPNEASTAAEAQGKTELVIPHTEKLSIAKAKFLNENTILLALLSNDIISYDIKNKKQNWKIQVSQSKFSNFALNEKKSEVVVADESGILKLYNTSNGSLIKTFNGQNLDNVFQVAYKNGIIATAGQDRRVVIYNAKTGAAYYKTAQFLIYSVGLSPSANLVGYSSDENNNVTLFDTNTKGEIGRFGPNEMTLSTILFINENEFIVSSDSNKINLYQIK
ncbi:MAG: WD40 repeat domain-containing protein [Sulfurimonas sp.]|jgi:outer membrane protein assembly factor BamB